ncbi:MAG: hypothetical protein ACPGQL_08745 [Thermoplasmatota archaeon]
MKPRFLLLLVGASLLGALLAGVYYAPENIVLREEGAPVFNVAAGEARVDFLEPSIEGGAIHVTVTVLTGNVDLYVMDQEWAASLTDAGALNLSQPFNYHKQWTALNVSGQHELTLVADGATRYAVVIDNTDNHYDGDTVPANATAMARVDMQTRYLAEEGRSLTLGYLAAIPSVVLVVYTLVRRWQRHRRGERLD